MNLQVIKKDSSNAVLVSCKELNVELWIDVSIEDNDVIADWNKYIFYLNNSEDVRIKAIQENSWNFELFTSVAIDYLEKNNVILQDDNGKWSEC